MPDMSVNIIDQIECFNIKLMHCGFDPHSFLKTTNKPLVSYGLFCILEGKGTYTLNGKTFPLNKRDVAFIPPSFTYTTFSETTAPFKLYFLQFYGPECETLLKRAGFSLDNPIIETNSDIISKKFKQIFKLLGKNTFYSIMKANVVFFEILLYFFKKVEANNVIYSDNIKYVLQTEDFIKNNYYKNINITEISKMLHINRSYLSYIFRIYKGITLKKYLTVYRIEKSLDLLTSTDLSILEIATSIGFNDSSNFYRQFKKMTSVSPQKYRLDVKQCHIRQDYQKVLLKKIRKYYNL